MADATYRADSARNNPTLQLPIARSTLLLMVRRACDDHGIAETRFGVEAVRDSSFVFGLRAGREPRIATQRRVLAYLASLNGEA